MASLLYKEVKPFYDEGIPSMVVPIKIFWNGPLPPMFGFDEIAAIACQMQPHESGDLGSQCVCSLARRNQVFLGCQDAIQNIATGLERIQIWLQSWGMINLCGEEVSQK